MATPAATAAAAAAAAVATESVPAVLPDESLRPIGIRRMFKVTSMSPNLIIAAPDPFAPDPATPPSCVVRSSMNSRFGRLVCTSVGFDGFAPRFRCVAESPGEAATARAPSFCD